jgi:BirA family biotin operon repressor/biotin-[acetyl-CoA-carboxylase] ligase
MSASIRTVAATGSTNDDMLAAAAAGAAEGLWLRADRQTGGKGRQGRDWESPLGNLYASTLVRLRPADPPAPSLALVAAVALHETLTLFAAGASIAIKWPNDILAGPAKLAGILLERVDQCVVAGFGANLADRPPETSRPATSLAALGAAAPDPHLVCETLAESFARWLARWRGEGLAPVRAAWLAAAHPLGTALSTHGPDGRRLEGLFEGLDGGGALRLRLADGSNHIVHAGDVFLI